MLRMLHGIAIVGAGFIGSECAAALKTHYKDSIDIHLIARSEQPLEAAFGKEIGKSYAKAHEAKGVKLHTGSGVKEISKDSSGNVTGVVLANGTTIKASMVLIGTGIAPATQFLAGSGIEMDNRGAIITDGFNQTSASDVFAAGDVASFPFWQSGEQTRIEHWITALEQGKLAAGNMQGKFQAYNKTPFFWTRSYDASTQYVGHCTDYDEVYIVGNYLADKFTDNKYIAYYIKGDKIKAVAAQGNSGALLTMFEAFNRNMVPKASDIKSGAVTPETLKD